MACQLGKQQPSVLETWSAHLSLTPGTRHVSMESSDLTGLATQMVCYSTRWPGTPFKFGSTTTALANGMLKYSRILVCGNSLQDQEESVAGRNSPSRQLLEALVKEQQLSLCRLANENSHLQVCRDS